jgi:hypothetical protein
MAGKAYDRTIFNRLERPMSPDHNGNASQVDKAVRDTLMRMYMGRVSATDDHQSVPTGFLGSCLKARAAGGMTVSLDSGLGFKNNTGNTASDIDGIGGLDDLSVFAPLILSALEVITIDPVPAAGSSRKDIIQVKVDRRTQDAESRDFLDPAADTVTPAAVNKTLSFDLAGRSGRVVTPNPSTTGIGYKVGASAVGALGAATEPAVDAGYVKVATINIDNSGGAKASIDESDIVDWRPYLVAPGGSIEMEIDADHTGPAATLQALNAPPGVSIGVGVSTGGGLITQVDVYVKAGKRDARPRAWVQPDAGDGFGNSPDGWIYGASKVIVGTDVSQATLAALPRPLTCAIGQELHLYQVAFGDSNPTTTRFYMRASL